MEPSKYVIRPFADSDYEDVARIATLVHPRMPDTAEDVRRRDELVTSRPERLVLRLVVDEVASRSPVAFGVLYHTIWNYNPDRYFVTAAVDPDHRRRGIGSALYTPLEGEARKRRAVCLWTNALEADPSSIRFAERHGFVPLRKTWVSRLKLPNLDVSNIPDRTEKLRGRGIRLTTLAAEGPDRPEVQRRLYELAVTTGRDAPRLGDYAPISFEDFVESELVGPKVIMDAIFLATDGEEYVGWSSLQRILDDPGTLDIGFTGTLSEFRGRGIASELKRRAVAYARDHGYASIVTGNDSLNPRIWAINEKLGFVKEDTWIQAEKRFPPNT